MVGFERNRGLPLTEGSVYRGRGVAVRPGFHTTLLVSQEDDSRGPTVIRVSPEHEPFQTRQVSFRVGTSRPGGPCKTRRPVQEVCENLRGGVGHSGSGKGRPVPDSVNVPSVHPIRTRSSPTCPQCIINCHRPCWGSHGPPAVRSRRHRRPGTSRSRTSRSRRYSRSQTAASTKYSVCHESNWWATSQWSVRIAARRRRGGFTRRSIARSHAATRWSRPFSYFFALVYIATSRACSHDPAPAFGAWSSTVMNSSGGGA